VLTPKIGKGRLWPSRPVRPGFWGGLTGLPMAGLAQGARRSNCPPPRGQSNRGVPISGRIRSLA
jgi:hypothetical protein